MDFWSLQSHFLNNCVKNRKADFFRINFLHSSFIPTMLLTTVEPKWFYPNCLGNKLWEKKQKNTHNMSKCHQQTLDLLFWSFKSKLQLQLRFVFSFFWCLRETKKTNLMSSLHRTQTVVSTRTVSYKLAVRQSALWNMQLSFRLSDPDRQFHIFYSQCPKTLSQQPCFCSKKKKKVIADKIALSTAVVEARSFEVFCWFQLNANLTKLQKRSRL